VQQQPPDPTRDWSQFPERIVVEVLYRIHFAEYEAGWFSSSGDGRFDLAHPRGTCYLSISWPPAVLEVLGGEMRGGLVCMDFFEGRRLSIVSLDPCRLADIAHPRAAGYDVTAQLATMTPYDIPQQWANFLDATEWSGIAYRLRFDPSAPDAGVALFGASGLHPLQILTAHHFGEEHFQILRNRYGVRVLPKPEFEHLLVVD
jgi:hypothetical protein